MEENSNFPAFSYQEMIGSFLILSPHILGVNIQFLVSNTYPIKMICKFVSLTKWEPLVDYIT